jgi:hypothetical protein
MIMRSALGLLAIVLTACGSVSREQRVTASVPPAAQGQARLEALPAQKLAAGQCGLFLFSRAPEPRFIFFANTEASALVKVDGRELHFVQQSETVQPSQERILRFTDEAHGSKIVLALSVAETGTESEISSGSLRFMQADGWESVVPVGGAITCEGG